MPRKVQLGEWEDIRTPIKRRGHLYEFYSHEFFLDAARETKRMLERSGLFPEMRRVRHPVLQGRHLAMPVYVLYTRK